MEPNHLFEYCLRLGDNSWILSHRMGELCSRGPFLEEDIATTNIALDHIGQAELFYTYAVKVEGKNRNENDLAYRRTEHEFYNNQLVEQPNSNFAWVVVKSFFMDAFNFYLYTALTTSSDEEIRAIAVKSLKEVSYHLRHSSSWIVRLGDGTEESKTKIQEAINRLWMFTNELFEMDETDDAMVAAQIGADLNDVKLKWDEKINEVLREATLTRPEDKFMVKGGRQGIHSEYLGYILSDTQYLNRVYPDATW